MLKYFDRKKLFVFITSIILGVLIISPQLQVKELAPLDFNESLYQGLDKTPTDALRGSITESHRFIPVRYLQRYVEFNLFGYSSRLRYLVNGIILGVIIFYSFLIIGHPDLSNYVFFVLTINLLPQLVDNFYRLGTAEPLFTMFVVAGVYYLTAGKYIWYIISFIFILTSKENSFFLAPFFVLFSFLKFKKEKYKYLTILFPYILASVFIVNMYFIVGGERYFSQYNFSITNGLTYLRMYITNDWPALMLLTITTLLYFLRKKNIEKTKTRSLLLLLFLAWFSLLPLILLYESYYLFLTLVLSTLSFILETDILVLSNGRKLAVYALFLLIFIFFQFGRTVNLAREWNTKLVGDAVLTKYLMSERDKTHKPAYYFLNKSFTNIDGAWLILTDFGKKSADFEPKPKEAWNTYQNFGDRGIDNLIDKIREQAFMAKGGVIIENPCVDIEKMQSRTLNLCGYSLLLRKPVCNWCVIQ